MATSVFNSRSSICEVQPYLYITCYKQSVAEAKLRNIGITHCVDVTNNVKTVQIPGIKYHFVGINDDDVENVKCHFEAAAEFIQRAKSSGGKVLVFCSGGVSRSATICIMSLVINEGHALKEAYQTVLAARPVIAPNLGFWRQMIEWEAEHNGDGKTTVKMVEVEGMKRPFPDVYLATGLPISLRWIID